MTIERTRRGFIVDAIAGIAGANFAFAGLAGSRAFAGEALTVVEWGGAYIDNMKLVAKKQDKFDINWVLHAGGAAAILPKIKTDWPKPKYDLVAGWDPVFQSVISEGWAEPVSVDNVPNLADIPEALLYRDAQGKAINIPRSISSIYWFYREDTCPIKITSLDDLLDPKLKGQICWPGPVLNTNLQTILLAMHRGGSAQNLEPGWAFLKELAKSGNIGRVANSDVDVTNSLSSGETSVSFQGAMGPLELTKNFPIKHLTKMPRASGLLSGIYQEGWVVLKGGKTAGALDFANFTISPENNEFFNAASGAIPTNVKAKVADNLAYLKYTEAEIKESAYIPDWTYISAQVDAWNKHWEKEIAPLL
jgi:putative spermidine/putrescine transport system substrate-binding protein